MIEENEHIKMYCPYCRETVGHDEIVEQTKRDEVIIIQYIHLECRTKTYTIYIKENEIEESKYPPLQSWIDNFNELGYNPYQE